MKDLTIERCISDFAVINAELGSTPTEMEATCKAISTKFNVPYEQVEKKMLIAIREENSKVAARTWKELKAKGKL